jgi:hypothetical protein
MAAHSCVWTAVLAIVLVLYVQTTRVEGLTDPSLPDIFYPFGEDLGDAIAPVNDDGYTAPIPIGIGFPFFDSNRTSLYVNTNGAVSFGAGVSTFTPNSFPILSASMIAIYWCDVDTLLNNGRIYYRETTDNTLLTRATRDIQSAFTSQGFYNFVARWMFIATWHNVTYYGGGQTTPIQSFQMILVTDGTNSFTMFNYGQLTWTTGTASGGSAATGLGGTPAQVGFNAGDAVNYYVVPWSRTADIVNIWTTSNVGTIGRWAFRISTARISAPSCTKPEGSDCYAWQTLTGTICTDIAPSFDCPVLTGPTVINRQWIEFYCTVPTNVTDPQARFNVSFLFDGIQYSDVPVFVVNAAVPRATLHERYLYGRLGKWLGCRILSYWANTANQSSQPVTSSNSYRPGIEATSSLLTVYENNPDPTRLVLKSTLPIVCSASVACSLRLRVVASADIAVRQRHPLFTTPTSCSYVIADSDWKPTEGFAYNTNGSLEIKAKTDTFATARRLNSLQFYVSTLPYKTVNGIKYPDPWDGYTLQPLVQVYRYDASQVEGVCTSSGDPHITTFDRFYYSTYATGQFIYARSTNGLPFEVHVRHWPCGGGLVACVCGVAMREDTTVLAADMCTDGVVHHITFGSVKSLPAGAGITSTDTGSTLKIQMPSGNKVLISVYSWGMSIGVHVSAATPTEGLCGSFDSNPSNDLKVRDTNRTVTLVSSDQPPDDFINSWRLDIGRSLFDGYLANLKRGDPAKEDLSTYCKCDANSSKTSCGGPAVTENNLSTMEPSTRVRVKVVALLLGTGVGGGRQSRRRRQAAPLPDERDDDIDFTYNSTSFRENQTLSVTPSWPTANGINESYAELMCRARIVNRTVIGPACYSRLANSSLTTTIVRKCMDDVKITGDFVWADDKVPEMQFACIEDVVTRNYSTTDNTAAARAALMADIGLVTPYRCDPFDCSQHGSCTNGICSCEQGYIGSGCNVPQSTVPSIVRLLDPAECDIRIRLCSSVSLQTNNVISIARCRVVVTQPGSMASQTYLTSTEPSGSTAVTICQLPVERLSLFSVNVNFTDVRNQLGPSATLDQVEPGQPVQTFTVSVSNDGGQRFSSETASVTVVDSRCMTCNGGICFQRSDSCLFNGYCFASNERNPFNSCQQCQPTVSNVTWTPIDAFCPVGFVPVDAMNGSCICVVSEADESSTSSASSSSTASTATVIINHTLSLSSTSSTSTAYRSAPQPTAVECNVGIWNVRQNWNSFDGVLQPSITTLGDCQQLCLLNLDCYAVDYDTSATPCWFHVSPQFEATGGSYPDVNQYVLNRTCVECLGAHWRVFANQNSFYGVLQSDVSSLVGCQRRCVTDPQCSAVDFAYTAGDGLRCWTHRSDDGYEMTRGPYPDTVQYVIMDRCTPIRRTPAPRYTPAPTRPPA